MYDFLCLLPHACASHSLIHYLNLHRDMHVASYTSIVRSLDDVGAYERHFRPFIDYVGIATKDYDTPEIFNKVLDACKRRLVIQTVRDPVECLAAQIYNGHFHRKIRMLVGIKVEEDLTIEEYIRDGVVRYITHAEAERVYEVDSFDNHRIIDVVDLRADKIEGSLNQLWIDIFGNAAAKNLISRDYFTSMGSKRITNLRSYGGFIYKEGGLKLRIMPVADGDLWIGNYDAIKNQYVGRETRLHTFPDINEYLPALELSGPLHMCTEPLAWHLIHPKLRHKVLESCLALFKQRMQLFDRIYSTAKETPVFSVDDFTPLQKEILKASIEADVRLFGKRHPEIVEKWDVTNQFLST